MLVGHPYGVDIPAGAQRSADRANKLCESGRPANTTILTSMLFVLPIFLASRLRLKLSTMEYLTLKSLNRQVSRIGLGTWSIGGWMWGGTDEQQAIRTVRVALDSEINLIDTAPVYGFGHSEEIVGQALAQSGRRDDIIIATKVTVCRGGTLGCASSRTTCSSDGS
jgi:hypothetical protein